MSVVGILDYGAGNLHNVCRALTHLSFRYILISESSQFSQIDKLIIPGVGAFAVAMNQLNELGLVAPILDFAATGKQILGICLGMQMLFDRSKEFGETNGLGLLSGTIEPIPSTGTDGQQHKIPHIGWSRLLFNTHVEAHKLTDGIDSFYFVHSFMAKPIHNSDIIAYCDYNGIQIPAIVGKNNIIGCQFHPEKSRQTGLDLLKKILEQG